MIRALLIICAFTVVTALAQQHTTTPGRQTSQTQPAPPPIPAQVAPDTPVITIHGLCPAGQKQPENTASCAVVLTRQQFDAMVSSINLNNQAYTPGALRGLATNYVTVLTLADAAERAGVDKDPRFLELMRISRIRNLAEAYRRYLQEKYSNPSAEEIAEYYKQNAAKYEQLKIDRIMVPRLNPKHPQENRVEFEKKARRLADDLRQRAANGEEMGALQVEAYKVLKVDSMPPPVEVNTTRKGVFYPGVEQEIKALKPGQVTKVEVEPTGFNIYKLRSRNAVPLEMARAEIVREISQKKIEAEMKSLTGHVHSDFNEQFFSLAGSSRAPARVTPPGVSMGNTGVHVVPPPASPR
ncbi:MAG TPA: peptidylprolyl isomerase [Candidatus Limnocylindrales bacterium]|nr:peptidylprolyl isomerase [Candidatus Limnocylindrales bacterium]